MYAICLLGKGQSYHETTEGRLNIIGNSFWVGDFTHGEDFSSSDGSGFDLVIRFRADFDDSLEACELIDIDRAGFLGGRAIGEVG